MKYFYFVHSFLLLYGIYQLVAMYIEISTQSETITIGGILLIPFVILSILRFSIGRILLAFTSMTMIVFIVVPFIISLFTNMQFQLYYLFDLVLFGYLWHLFKPYGKWYHLYSKYGIFQKKDKTSELGRKYLKDIRSENFQIDDVQINFMNYCKSYLVKKSNLTENQVDLLMLDPELGENIDEVMMNWLTEDIGMGNDVDEFLVPKKFDAPQMKRINLILDNFSIEFPERESKIIKYLQSIGYF